MTHVFKICMSPLESSLAYSQLIPSSFLAYSWHISNLSLAYFQLIPNLFLTHSKVIPLQAYLYPDFCAVK